MPKRSFSSHLDWPLLGFAPLTTWALVLDWPEPIRGARHQKLPQQQ